MIRTRELLFMIARILTSVAALALTVGSGGGGVQA